LGRDDVPATRNIAPVSTMVPKGKKTTTYIFRGWFVGIVPKVIHKAELVAVARGVDHEAVSVTLRRHRWRQRKVHGVASIQSLIRIRVHLFRHNKVPTIIPTVDAE
jgi:hypothetical protein